MEHDAVSVPDELPRQITTAAEAKKVVARMTAHEAMRTYHAQAGERAKANEHAAKMLDYRRLLGAWYARLERDRGGHASKYAGNTAVTSIEAAMAELGHTTMTRRRLEVESSIPAGVYKSWVAETMATSDEILTASALRKLARAPKAYDPPAVEFDPPQVWCMSWEDWLPTQPECDLLLTDPPYMTDVDDVSAFAAEWLPAALKKVKPTGRAYVCIGAYPEELKAYLAVDVPSHMSLSQVLVWTYRNTLGQNPRNTYKLNWQAILYYLGSEAPPLDVPQTADQFAVFDINAPDGRVGDRCHTWQKPDRLAEIFIQHATRQGELVLDPFCCTGTFVLAANRLGRIGRGCDISRENLSLAERRGCQCET